LTDIEASLAQSALRSPEYRSFQIELSYRSLSNGPDAALPASSESATSPMFASRGSYLNVCDERS